MKQNFKGKTIIITGSSMGIGKATALLALKKGANVVINGRNRERLEKTWRELQQEAPERVLAIAGDMLKDNDIDLLLQQTINTFGQVDVFINNAGISSRGRFETLTREVIERVIDVNYIASALTAQKVIPHLKKTGGSFFFISSVAGIRGLPAVSVYSSAKMALTALAESLRLEYHDSPMHFGIIYVGYTQNETDKRILGADGKLIALAERSAGNAQTIEQVAQIIMRSVEKRKFKTILSSMGKLNAIMNKLMPRFVDRLLIYSMKKMPQMYQ